jgi:RNA polymerase sigma-70 factor (ECF subfamily)
MDSMTKMIAGSSPGPEKMVSPQPLPLGLGENRESCAAHGDMPSLEQVYFDYAARVYHTARRMVQSDADAEDVTQDVLLKVVRKLPSFRGEAALPTWLHRITVNTALSHRRKRVFREQHRVGRDFHDWLDREAEKAAGHQSVPRPEEEAVEHETRQLLDRAIAALPPRYRGVFVLADIDGLPNATIAEMLGLSLPAVKSRLHRARLLLRDALAGHFQNVTT